MTYSFWHIFNNPIFWPALTSYLLAQVAKIVLRFIETKYIDLKLMTSTGGMPSSHAALVMSVCVTVGIHTGFDSIAFGIAATVAAVIMYDATGVRYESGKQAKAINTIVELMSDGDFETHFSELKELLGHRPIEVLVGAILGIAVAIIASLF